MSNHASLPCQRDSIDGILRESRSLCDLSAKSSVASIDILSRSLQCAEGSERLQITPLFREMRNEQILTNLKIFGIEYKRRTAYSLCAYAVPMQLF
jgi:hypothetical protein